MKRYVIYAIIAFLFSSCTKAVIEEEAIVIIEDVVYDPDIKNIMSSYCITCHGGAAPSASVALESYTDVRYYSEFENLIDRMNDSQNPMPPSGILSSEILSKIDKWAADGFPEN